MKTLKIVVIAGALLFSGKTFAAGYGTAGCGLGSLAFGNQAGPVQILAATTNATFWNQTFGITSGTSNCGPGMLTQGTKDFVDANREVLAKDAARGQGDAIGAIAVINQCTNVPGVAAALQKNFRSIFPSEATSNEEVTQALLQTLHADKSLGCGAKS